MPRIRKKTSNRGTTNDRRKLLTKVRESKKKKAKAAKKNPQWKSKTKKDPGIPNTFPYKDQILAEIADQRRVAAEEKQRRKEQKKIKNKAVDDDSDTEDEDVEDAGSDNENPDANADEVFAEVKALGLAQGFDGIASLSAKRLDNRKLKPREVPMEVDEPVEEEEVPVLINRDLLNLQAVLNEADVIVEVLDARDPLPYRSAHLEELASATSSKRVLLVLNKIDTCPRESVASWTTYLRAHYPTLPFRAASAFLPAGPEPAVKEKGKGKAKAPTQDATGVDSVLECLGEWAAQKEGDEPLCVAVVGFTNVGKSSFVNSLLKKSAFPIYTLATSSRGPTTTTYAQEVTLEVKGKPIRLIDTPGISWEANADAEDVESIDIIRTRDILMRSKGRIDRLKDPVIAAQHIVARSNTEDLMLLYSLPAFSAGDTDSFLSCVARANQLVKKKGELDLTGAARIVLRDWSTGKFPRYTAPPSSESSTPLSTADEKVQATLQTRKDMRKARGLVKLTCGAVETRKALIELPWAPASPESDSEDDDGAEEEEENGEVEEDDEMNEEEADAADKDDSDDAEEELGPPAALSGKQKRKRVAEKEPKSRKKVSFGPDPKTSKQARSAGSLQKKPIAAVKEKPLKTAAPKKAANTAVKTKQSQKGPATSSVPGQEYNFGEFF
ncbi:Guanine nucleotide-binding protein-like 3 [Mycena sanguinolenta]|uniref:Guanine nucleotide-binding protein-like 3 n=1 Tax=Mycena sanguinolenta TaxID=230812 RepID=A0A8H7D0S7_9AGAR|nr:Guanine nucleotide-binding protein-like 3 [Mycena sanguinolenta]